MFLQHLPSNILEPFGNEMISEYESGKLNNSEGTVYMLWSIVFANQTEFSPKIIEKLHQKLEVFDMKSLKTDAVGLDMNLATEMLRFPQPNTNFLEKSLLYSISAIGCELMSIKNAAQNLFSTSIKMVFKDSQTLGPFQNHVVGCLLPFVEVLR